MKELLKSKPGVDEIFGHIAQVSCMCSVYIIFSGSAHTVAAQGWLSVSHGEYLA